MLGVPYFLFKICHPLNGKKQEMMVTQLSQPPFMLASQ